MTVSASKGAVVPLLSAVTTGTGLGVAIPNVSKEVRLHVRGSGVVSGGTIVIEEALDPEFAGTWSLLSTITAASFTGGVEQVIHIISNIGSIRARVTANVTGGGTMSIDLVTA